MVATDLHDTLTAHDDPSGQITLACDDPSLPTGADNLVVRAALALRREADVSQGATLTLSKAIPAQAGLAGGSSDAAATLVALDSLWGLNLPASRLEALAATIGSDVAFFLNGPAAVCRGRGEQVESLSLPIPLHCVVICPPVGLSTAEVYRHVRVPVAPRPVAPILAALSSGDRDALGPCLFNRLQDVAETIRPELRRLRLALDNLGPGLDGHLMSGSGSAYFGLARDLAAAQAAAHRLSPQGLGQVRVVTSQPRDLSSTA
jgi:4-diphosphocytidyl-2-C-methyl-D-erythritol kinase